MKKNKDKISPESMEKAFSELQKSLVTLALIVEKEVLTKFDKFISKRLKEQEKKSKK